MSLPALSVSFSKRYVLTGKALGSTRKQVKMASTFNLKGFAAMMDHFKTEVQGQLSGHCASCKLPSFVFGDFISSPSPLAKAVIATAIMSMLADNIGWHVPTSRFSSCMTGDMQSSSQ